MAQRGPAVPFLGREACSACTGRHTACSQAGRGHAAGLRPPAANPACNPPSRRARITRVLITARASPNPNPINLNRPPPLHAAHRAARAPAARAAAPAVISPTAAPTGLATPRPPNSSVATSASLEQRNGGGGSRYRRRKRMGLGCGAGGAGHDGRGHRRACVLIDPRCAHAPYTQGTTARRAGRRSKGTSAAAAVEAAGGSVGGLAADGGAAEA
eukprot:scaffold22333_cov45-Phaeocystis_antarctica.AAC.3